MANTSFETRRGELKTYFGETAADKWVALTSQSPVSRIRETVRAGREETRDTLMGWLPQDLTGKRLLDAGCGTGVLAVEAANRGADVVAVDISEALVNEARARMPANLGEGSITYIAGDMSAEALGDFDHVVAMDSFIHYPLPSIISLLEGLAPRARESILLTFAPATPMLRAMKAAGTFFPKNDRSPAIEPVAERKITRAAADALSDRFGFRPSRLHRVSTAFYKSTALELVKR